LNYFLFTNDEMVQLFDHSPGTLIGWVPFLGRSHWRLEKYCLRPVQPSAPPWKLCARRRCAHGGVKAQASGDGLGRPPVTFQKGVQKANMRV